MTQVCSRSIVGAGDAGGMCGCDGAVVGHKMYPVIMIWTRGHQDTEN